MRPDYARPGGPWDGPALDQLDPPSVVDGEVTLTVEDLRARAAAVAGALRERGVRRGDAVAWQLPNWWEAVVLYHACWRLGAVAVPLHHRGGAAARADVLDRVEARALLVAHDLEPPEEAVVVRGPVDEFGALVAAEPGSPDEGPQPGDLAALLATSGATGRRKIVRHTHRTLGYKARSMARVHGLGPEDVVLMPAPLAHISGLLNGVLVPGAAGMTTVVQDRWDPASAVELIAGHRVSFMVGPPTFFVDLGAQADATPERLASLRIISSGGAGVTPEFVESASATLGALVKRTYGSTEAPTVTTSHEGDPRDRARDTEGRPVGEVELLVTHPGSGERLPPGTTGELWVRGPEVCEGYLDPAATAEAFDDGWFRTGDLARVDADGWLTIVGRVKDTIIRGGENISPSEVESVCDTLAGVRQAVVVGYPDERLGERVGLVVEADAAPDLDTVRQACQEAGLARFAWPERLARVDAMPVLEAGKPDRQAARRILTRTETATT